MKARNLTFVGAISFMGCGVVAPSFVNDGFRDQARVTMLSEPAQFVSDVDWSGAIRQAEETCRAWGYDGGSPYDGVRSQTVIVGTSLLGAPLYGTQFSRTFQCEGSPSN